MDPVDLDFIEHQRPPGPGYRWHPFGDSRNFDTGWWSQRSFLPTSRLLSVESDGVEVARVEIDRDPRPVSPVGPVREIHYLEVSQVVRRRRIGPEVVERLVAESCGSRLIATTETAIGWWTKLGWQPFDHGEPLPNGWAAFVSPVPSWSC